MAILKKEGQFASLAMPKNSGTSVYARSHEIFEKIRKNFKLIESIPVPSYSDGIYVTKDNKYFFITYYGELIRYTLGSSSPYDKKTIATVSGSMMPPIMDSQGNMLLTFGKNIVKYDVDGNVLMRSPTPTIDGAVVQVDVPNQNQYFLKDQSSNLYLYNRDDLSLAAKAASGQVTYQSVYDSCDGVFAQACGSQLVIRDSKSLQIVTSMTVSPEITSLGVIRNHFLASSSDKVQVFEFANNKLAKIKEVKMMISSQEICGDGKFVYFNGQSNGTVYKLNYDGEIVVQANLDVAGSYVHDANRSDYYAFGTQSNSLVVRHYHQY